MKNWLDDIKREYFHWTTLIYFIGNMLIFGAAFAFIKYDVIEGWIGLVIFGLAVLLMEFNKRWVTSFKKSSDSERH